MSAKSSDNAAVDVSAILRQKPDPQDPGPAITAHRPAQVPGDARTRITNPNLYADLMAWSLDPA